MADVVQKYVSFRHDMLDFVPSDNGFLLENLDGIALPGHLLSAQVDLRRQKTYQFGCLSPCLHHKGNLGMAQ